MLGFGCFWRGSEFGAELDEFEMAQRRQDEGSPVLLSSTIIILVE